MKFRRFLAMFMASTITFTSMPMNAITASASEQSEQLSLGEELLLSEEEVVEPETQKEVPENDSVQNLEELILDDEEDEVIDAFEDTVDLADEEKADEQPDLPDPEESLEENVEPQSGDVFIDEEPEDEEVEEDYTQNLSADVMANAIDLPIGKRTRISLDQENKPMQYFKINVDASDEYIFASKYVPTEEQEQNGESYFDGYGISGFLYDSEGSLLSDSEHRYDWDEVHNFYITENLTEKSIYYLCVVMDDSEWSQTYDIYALPYRSVEEIVSVNYPSPEDALLTNLPFRRPDNHVTIQYRYEGDDTLYEAVSGTFDDFGTYFSCYLCKTSELDSDIYHDIYQLEDEPYTLSIHAYLLDNSSTRHEFAIDPITPSEYFSEHPEKVLTDNSTLALTGDPSTYAYYQFKANTTGVKTLKFANVPVDRQISIYDDQTHEFRDYIYLNDTSTDTERAQQLVSDDFIKDHTYTIVIMPSDYNQSPDCGTVTVTDGVKPNAIDVDIPETMVYDEGADLVSVTLHYEDSSVPAQTLYLKSWEWRYVRDSYGNKVSWRWDDYNVGTSTLTISCTGVSSQTYNVNMISRIDAGYGSDQIITLPGDPAETPVELSVSPIRVISEDSGKIETIVQFFQLSVLESGSYHFDISATDPASIQAEVRNCNEENLVWINNYDNDDEDRANNTQTVNLAAGTYLLQVGAESEGTLTISPAAALTDFSLCDNPEQEYAEDVTDTLKVDDIWDIFERYYVKASFDDGTDRIFNLESYNDYVDADGYHIQWHVLNADNIRMELEDDDLPYGQYTFLLNCGNLFKRYTVEYMSEYDLHISDAKELKEGVYADNPIDDDESTGYYAFTAEHEGTYFLATTDLMGAYIVDTEDTENDVTYLPALVTLQAGDSVLLKTSKNLQDNDQGILLKNIQNLPKADLTGATLYDSSSDAALLVEGEPGTLFELDSYDNASYRLCDIRGLNYYQPFSNCSILREDTSVLFHVVNYCSSVSDKDTFLLQMFSPLNYGDNNLTAEHFLKIHEYESKKARYSYQISDDADGLYQFSFPESADEIFSGYYWLTRKDEYGQLQIHETGYLDTHQANVINAKAGDNICIYLYDNSTEPWESSRLNIQNIQSPTNVQASLTQNQFELVKDDLTLYGLGNYVQITYDYASSTEEPQEFSISGASTDVNGFKINPRFLLKKSSKGTLSSVNNIDKAGDYVVKIDFCGTQYDLPFTVLPFDESEANIQEINDDGSFIRIPADGMVIGKFTVTEKSRYLTYARGDCDFRFYNQNTNELIFSYGLGNSQSRDTFEPGTYYMRVANQRTTESSFSFWRCRNIQPGKTDLSTYSGHDGNYEYTLPISKEEAGAYSFNLVCPSNVSWYMHLYTSNNDYIGSCYGHDVAYYSLDKGDYRLELHCSVSESEEQTGDEVVDEPLTYLEIQKINTPENINIGLEKTDFTPVIDLDESKYIIDYLAAEYDYTDENGVQDHYRTTGRNENGLFKWSNLHIEDENSNNYYAMYDHLAPGSYTLYGRFFGQEYTFPFRVSALSEDKFIRLESGKANTISANETAYFVLHAINGSYQFTLSSGGNVPLYDENAQKQYYTDWYGSTFAVQKGTYYIPITNDSEQDITFITTKVPFVSEGTNDLKEQTHTYEFYVPEGSGDYVDYQIATNEGFRAELRNYGNVLSSIDSDSCVVTLYRGDIYHFDLWNSNNRYINGSDGAQLTITPLEYQIEDVQLIGSLQWMAPYIPTAEDLTVQYTLSNGETHTVSGSTKDAYGYAIYGARIYDEQSSRYPEFVTAGSYTLEYLFAGRQYQQQIEITPIQDVETVLTSGELITVPAHESGYYRFTASKADTYYARRTDSSLDICVMSNEQGTLIDSYYDDDMDESQAYQLADSSYYIYLNNPSSEPCAFQFIGKADTALVEGDNAVDIFRGSDNNFTFTVPEDGYYLIGHDVLGGYAHLIDENGANVNTDQWLTAGDTYRVELYVYAGAEDASLVEQGHVYICGVNTPIVLDASTTQDTYHTQLDYPKPDDLYVYYTYIDESGQQQYRTKEENEPFSFESMAGEGITEDDFGIFDDHGKRLEARDIVNGGTYPYRYYLMGKSFTLPVTYVAIDYENLDPLPINQYFTVKEEDTALYSLQVRQDQRYVFTLQDRSYVPYEGLDITILDEQLNIVHNLKNEKTHGSNILSLEAGTYYIQYNNQSCYDCTFAVYPLVTLAEGENTVTAISGAPSDRVNTKLYDFQFIGANTPQRFTFAYSDSSTYIRLRDADEDHQPYQQWANSSVSMSLFPDRENILNVDFDSQDSTTVTVTRREAPQKVTVTIPEKIFWNGYNTLNSDDVSISYENQEGTHTTTTLENNFWYVLTKEGDSSHYSLGTNLEAGHYTLQVIVPGTTITKTFEVRTPTWHELTGLDVMQNLQVGENQDNFYVFRPSTSEYWDLGCANANVNVELSILYGWSDDDLPFIDNTFDNFTNTSFNTYSDATYYLHVTTDDENASLALRPSRTSLLVELSDPDESFTWDGNPQTPDVVVTDENETPLDETQYTLVYSDNTEPGQATVTAKGLGIYQGLEESAYFTIDCLDLDDDLVDVTWGTTSFVYNGTKQVPEVTVARDGIPVSSEEYYIEYWGSAYEEDLSYSYHGEARSYWMVLKGQDVHYTGEIRHRFTVNPKDVADEDVTVSAIADQEYTGEAITPSFELEYGDMTLSSGTDYATSYSNNLDAGTATITISGQGNYTGTKTIEFQILEPQKDASEVNPIPLTENTALDALPIETWYSIQAEGPTKIDLYLTQGNLEESHFYLLSEDQAWWMKCPSALNSRDSDSYLYHYSYMLESGTAAIQVPVETKMDALITKPLKLNESFTVNNSLVHERAQQYLIDTEQDWDYTISSDENIELHFETPGGTGVSSDRKEQKIGLKKGRSYLSFIPANTNEAQVTFSALNAPEKLTLQATPTIKQITLTWSSGIQTYTKYKLYRQNSAGEFVLLTTIDDRDTTQYIDENLEAGKEYSYYITALYGDYTEGAPSDIVTATPKKDTIAPTIRFVEPTAEARKNGRITIRSAADDNIKVSKMTLSVRPWRSDDEQQAEWELLRTAYGNSMYYYWDTSDQEKYPDGYYQIKVEAYDSSDNTANPKLVRYQIDNSGPSKVTGLTEEHTSVTLALHWSNVPEEDHLYYFKVEQLKNNEWVVVANASALGYEVTTGLKPETSYTYRVVGYDDLGNRGIESDEITVTTSVDETIPVITAQSVSGSTPVYNEQFTYEVRAEDDYQIAEIWYEYTRDTEVTDDTQWTVLEDTRAVYGETDIQRTRTLKKQIDVSSMEEGLLTIRALAKDAYGHVSNSGSDCPLYQVKVDHTAPAAPTWASAPSKLYGQKVQLFWNQNNEQDAAQYMLYRSDAEDEEGTCIAIGNRISYVDETTNYDQSYWYFLTAQDLAGNVSPMSERIKVIVPRDDVKPEIKSFSPKDGETLNAKEQPKVYVTDNARVQTLNASYRTDSATSWTALEPITLQSQYELVTLPISAEKIGSNVHDLYIQVYAEDYSGNQSEKSMVHYAVDAEAPSVSEVTAAITQEGQVVVTWASAAEEDLAGFYINRRIKGSSNWSTIAQRAAKTGETGYTATDKTVSDNVTYEYQIRALDIHGNYSDSEICEINIPEDTIAEPEDTTAPYAFITASQVCESGKYYNYSADQSKDDRGITSYAWDFGDGTTSDKPNTTHRFEADGTYIVSLTVKDAAGNEDTTSITVEAITLGQLGTVNVHVVSEKGVAVSEAGVYFDLGKEDMNILTTDLNGNVTFTALSGTYPVGVYKDGFLPAKQDVDVAANGEVDVQIVIEEKDIVTGVLEWKAMTLEDIIAAGININDPANQNFFKFTIELTYGTEKPITLDAYCDGEGRPVGQTHWIRRIVDWDIDVDINIIDWIWPSPGPNPGPGGGGYVYVTPKPVIAILEIPGEASWLKDFFDVSLSIKNEATEEFYLDNSVATLKVPHGLTLMDSNYTTADPVVNMGTIQGGETKVARWILRGDEPGDNYYISATFNAILRDFGAEINREFKNTNPIEVRDGSNLWLDIVTENEILENTDGAIRVGFRNESSTDVNCPSVTLEKVEKIRTYKTAGNSVSFTDERVLKPGEELWTDFLISRSDWKELIENEDSTFYLYKQIIKKLEGMQMQVSFNTVSPLTICADKIEVYRYDDELMTSEFNLVSIDKDSAKSAKVPPLMIKTYRYDPSGQLVPASMEVKVKDGYKMAHEPDGSEQKNGYTVTTNENGIAIIDGYDITDWKVGLGEDNENNLNNYKAYEINFYTRRAYRKLPVVARGKTATKGVLTVNVLGQREDGSSFRMNGATVAVENLTATTAGKGQAVFKGIGTGKQEITITAKGYDTLKTLVEVDEDTTETYTLLQKDDTKRSHVTGITHTLFDNTRGNMAIIPEGTLTGTATFTLNSQLAEGETFKCYVARVVDKDGREILREDFTDITHTLDMSVLKAGYRVGFAVTVQADDGEYTSRFRDANLKIVSKPGFMSKFTKKLTDLFGETKFKLDGQDTASFLLGELKGKKYSSVLSSKNLVIKEHGDEDEVKAMMSLMEKVSYDIEDNSKVYPVTADYDVSTGTLTINMTIYNYDQSRQKVASSGIVYMDDTSLFALNLIEKHKKVSVTSSIVFSFEFSYDPVTNNWYLTVYGTVDGKLKINLGTLEAKYAYASAEASASGSLKAQMLRKRISGDNTLQDLTEYFALKKGSVTVDMRLAAGGQFLKKDLASIGLYGDLSLTTKFSPLLSVNYLGEIGWEGSVLWYPLGNPIVQFPGTLISEHTASSRAPRRLAKSAAAPVSEELLLAGQEADQVLMADEDAQEAENAEEIISPNMRLAAAAPKSIDGSDWVGSNNTLSTGVYYDAKQQMVKLSDGRTLLVYTDYNSQNDASNPVSLFYSISNSDGTWSTPKAVLLDGTEGTIGIDPTLFSQNGKIILTWMNMNEALSEETLSYGDLAEKVYAKMGVRSAVYNESADSWEALHTLNAGSVVTSPVTLSRDEEYFTAWITNRANATHASVDDPDEIQYSLNGQDIHTLTLDTLNTSLAEADRAPEYDITALDAELAEDGFTILIETQQETDEELQTHLYTNTFKNGYWLGFKEVGDANVTKTAPLCLGDWIYYAQGERIFRTNVSGSGRKQIALSDTLTKVSQLSGTSYGDTGVILSWVERDNESTIYAIMSTDGNSFSDPFTVATVSGNVKTPKITSLEDGWLFIYEQGVADAESKQNVYSLLTTKVSKGQDLFIETTDTLGYLYPSQEAITGFTIGNRGLSATKAKAVISASEDGTDPLTSISVKGMTGTIKWTVPATYHGEPYYLVVLPDTDGAADSDMSDNAVRIGKDLVDLQIGSVTYEGEDTDGAVFMVHVKNDSTQICEAPVLTFTDLSEVTDDEQENVLYKATLEALSSGASTDNEVTVHVPTVPADESGNRNHAIMVSISGFDTEENLENNQALVSYSEKSVTEETFDVENPSYGNVGAFADDSIYEGDNVTWAIEAKEDTDKPESVLTLSGNGETASYTSGQALWYSQREKITSIIIEDGVTKLGANLFEGFTTLESVQLPLSLTSIDAQAFAGSGFSDGSEKQTVVNYQGNLYNWYSLTQSRTANQLIAHSALQTVDFSDEAKADAQTVTESINAIDQTTPDDQALKSALESYDRLTEEEKFLIADETHALLTAAWETKNRIDNAAVNAVLEQITALNTATPDDDALAQIHADLNGLTADQKTILETQHPEAVEKVSTADANKATIDQAAADAVKAAIATIDQTEPIKADIRKAQNSFDALTRDQKLLFTAENAVPAFKEAKSTLDNVIIDADASDKVELVIQAIDTDTPTNDQITAARTAYSALSERQKYLVADSDKEALDKAITDQDAASRVAVILNALKLEPLDTDANIHAAEKAFADLTPLQQSLVVTTATDHLAAVQQSKAAKDQNAAVTVKSLIDQIDPAAPTDETIRSAQTAFNTLSEDQKKLFTDENADDDLKDAKAALDDLIQDANAADEAERLINAIDQTAPTNDQITAARIAFNELNDRQKYLVAASDKETLTVAATNQDEAIRVAALLNDLSLEPLDTDANIHAAEKAFTDLTPLQQSLVVTTATDHLAAVQQSKAAKDQNAAATVKSLIDQIDPAAPTDETIRSTETAFNALSEDQKKLFTDENADDDLKDAKDILDALILDANAADEAERLINAINQAAPTNEQITAAKEAYVGLNERQKTLVSDTDITKLNKAVTDQDTAAAVTRQLNELSLEPLSSDEAIHAAQNAYEALSPEQKSLIASDASGHLDEVTTKKAEIDHAAVAHVQELINQIDADAPSEKDVKAAQAALDALSEDQKALITSSEELSNAMDVLDNYAAKVLLELVDEKIDPNHPAMGDIKEVKAQYDNLTEEQKEKLSEIDQDKAELMTNLIDIAAEAEKVMQMVDQINPNAPTNQAIDTASRTFENLKTKAQEVQLPAAVQLVTQEYTTKLAAYKASQSKANAVSQQMLSLNLAKANANAAAIAEAENAYNSLTAAEKALVNQAAVANVSQVKAQKAQLDNQKQQAEEKRRRDIASFRLNVANGSTVPLKTKQKSTAVKAAYLGSGDRLISVTSSNPNAVIVSLSGNAINMKAGKKKGTSTITVRTALGATATFNIKVQTGKVKAKKMPGLPKAVTLHPGQTLQLSSVVEPVTTPDKVKFSTSKKKVATVSKSGLITAKKAGTAKIKVKCGSKSFTVKVTVK